MSASAKLPHLYVEGRDDVSVISNLLKRHGMDTKRGNAHLIIHDVGNVGAVLDAIPDAIKASTYRPVGFLLDIDVDLTDRWNAVRTRLQQVGVATSEICPKSGYLGKLAEYPHNFGVWLMPDCERDFGKMEHLIKTLVPENDPLWPVAGLAVQNVPKIVDVANRDITDPEKHWPRFRDVDVVKSHVHTWLAWQRMPGAPLGAAINDRILGKDSASATALLRWIKNLYGIRELDGL